MSAMITKMNRKVLDTLHNREVVSMDLLWKVESVLRDLINVKNSMKTITAEHVVTYMDKRIYILFMVSLRMVSVLTFQMTFLISLIKYPIKNRYTNADISLTTSLRR